MWTIEQCNGKETKARNLQAALASAQSYVLAKNGRFCRIRDYRGRYRYMYGTNPETGTMSYIRY